MDEKLSTPLETVEWLAAQFRDAADTNPGEEHHERDAAGVEAMRDVFKNMLASLKTAVERVKLANADGNPILSAWLPEAKAAIATTSPHTAQSAREPTFRDHLSPVMQSALAFEYYEVRPCIERDGQVVSYTDEDDYAAELVGLQSWGEEFRTFWSLYGLDAGAHTPIGDFISRDAAHEVMNAILAVPAAARNAINAALPVRRAGSRIEHIAGKAADWLDDMINQSSNGQRI